MKLLNVNMSVDPISGGGTAERCIQMSRFLADLGVETTLLTTDIGIDQLSRKDFFKFKIVSPHCLNRRFYISRLSYHRAFELVQAADVVHLMNHWTYLNALIGHIALRLKKPYAVCPAGALPIYGRSGTLKRIFNFVVGKRIIKFADAHVAVSQNEIAHYGRYGVSSEQVTVIPNGVYFNDFASKDVLSFRYKYHLNDFPFILFMGRLNHIKGPDLLLQAFSIIKDQINEYHLVFIGPDGGMLDLLKKTTVALKLDKRVHFLGYLGGADKSRAYHGADLLVIPSRQEAMSIVVLEAGAASTPVMLTDQCGFNTVETIGGGRVVAASIADISAGLVEMLHNPNMLKSMGKKLNEFVEKYYGWDKIAHQYFKLFEHLLSSSLSL